jgi:hypothetical protein
MGIAISISMHKTVEPHGQAHDTGQFRELLDLVARHADRKRRGLKSRLSAVGIY